jgi:Arc/MetJ-type ribon-helix-helix transcriptional regulator
MNRDKLQDSRIAARIPSNEKQEVEKLIAAGKAKNISQVIRVALQEFLRASA